MSSQEFLNWYAVNKKELNDMDSFLEIERSDNPSELSTALEVGRVYMSRTIALKRRNSDDNN